MNGFIELTQTKGGPTLVNIESIDRVKRLMVAPNRDEQAATILHLRNGEVVYVSESYREVSDQLAKTAGVSKFAVIQDDVPQ